MGGREKPARDRNFPKYCKRLALQWMMLWRRPWRKQIDFFERFDRMLASAEARRNNALREIDRHRSALSAAVRQVVDEVEDAEFRDVETGEVSECPSP